MQALKCTSFNEKTSGVHSEFWRDSALKENWNSYFLKYYSRGVKGGGDESITILIILKVGQVNSVLGLGWI